MLYDNVMVPYDGSLSADAALAEAVRYAKEDPGMKLHIVQIVDMNALVIEKLEEKGRIGAAVADGMREAVEEAHVEARGRLHFQVAGAIENLMNDVLVEILEETDPGTQIVEYAQKHRCDLIIMGSRGLGGIRGMLGSVSSHVLREAHVPVLVVKHAE